jgi:DNA-binding transcriptional ArsR family regulator
MDESTLPDLYELESVEQLLAIADELRQRILEALIERAMTVTQLGERLGLAPSKVHYHVRELERVGLVRLVETREKGGILEKYYRCVGRDVTVPASLLRGLPPDELLATVTQYFDTLRRGFLRALPQALERAGTETAFAANVALSSTHLWTTPEEFHEILRLLEEATKPYLSPRGIEGERERTLSVIAYETADADVAEEPEPEPAEARRRRVVTVGVQLWNRAGLERLVARGERLDATAIGVQVFADDVSAELVDRAIARFRHRGPLRASPGVRAVLQRKQTSQESS